MSQNTEQNLKKTYRQGVGLVILNKQGQIFAASRIDYKDAWQMPQGGIDEGEEPLEAAMREVEEEIGTNNIKIIKTSDHWYSYDYPPEVMLTHIGRKFCGQRQLWFLCEFLGEDSEINIQTAIPEFNEWCWISAEDLLASIVSFKKQLYRDVLGEFKLL